MIPLRDTIPSRHVPFVNYALIVLNLVAFAMQLLSPDGGEAIVNHYGMIPARSLAFFGGYAGLEEAFLPFLTYNFLHGGFLHIGGNMLYLWIFGDNVEDYFGHTGYLLFYLLAGIGAGLAHAVLNLGSEMPLVGASGAIAGVMGAYFILYPRARILTLVPIFIFIQFMEIPAVLFLGFWILLQFLSGAGGGESGGVAWWAHIGGFFIGIVLLIAFRKTRKGPGKGSGGEPPRVVYIRYN
ncbi:MAG: rhomboid family intramembrane serine protease [Myxococcales bacterium]|nr:MAG: rhomboid family intramembrane serine protease [Myxococcales bacterium]